MGPLHLLHSAYTCPPRGGSRGGVSGMIAPHKTYESNFFTMILYNSENSIRDVTALGSGSTASAPVSDVSAPACTNGVWPLLRLVSVEHRNRPLILLYFNVQSIDLPWTERPDGFEWRDHRMAAQHLPRDL